MRTWTWNKLFAGCFSSNVHQTRGALWLITFLQGNKFCFLLSWGNILVWTPCFNTTIITERPGLIQKKTKLSGTLILLLVTKKHKESAGREKRKRGPPLASAAAADDWYDSEPIQTANFTHDWGSIGCNELAFLNIALEWLCDHQHNSCCYSFGPSTHFSLCQVHCVIMAELWVNPRLWFLAITGGSVLSISSEGVNCPLSRFMESLGGHRGLPGGAGPTPCSALSNYTTGCLSFSFYKDLWIENLLFYIW